MSRIHHVLFCCCAILVGSAASAQTAAPTVSLGRLFLTPDARTTLERQRQLNIQETKNIEGGSIRLDGVVVRSSGKTTVWVNNNAQSENARDTGVDAALSRRAPDRATLTTGTEPPADLKVGVSLNRATRETTGGLAAGEIRVNRPATK